MILYMLLDQEATIHYMHMVKGVKGYPVRTEIGSDVYPCRVDQRSAVEDTLRTDMVTTLKLLILPPFAAVEADDEVTIDGRRYQVVGHPDRLRAFGREHHVEATLRSVTEV